jgi:ABC-type amino acid transport substrate-binding protein
MVLSKLSVIAVLLALFLAVACGLDKPQDPLGRQERAWVKEHSPIKVGVQKDYPPFSFLGPAGEPQGISIGIWKLMAEKYGFEVQFYPSKLKKMLAGLKEGRLDSLAGIFPTAQRKELFDFSKPFYPVATSIFVYYKVHDVDGMEDLGNIKVGAVKGDSGQAIVEKAGYKPQLFSNYKDAVLALGKGELDAIVMDDPVVLYYRKQLGFLDKIEWAEGHPVLDRSDLALPVKKGNQALLRILNKGLAMASGSEMQRLRERWLK